MESVKYFCPYTGAHFSPIELSLRLEKIRVERKDRKCDQWSLYVDIENCDVSSTSCVQSHDSENFIEETMDEQLLAPLVKRSLYSEVHWSTR